MQYVSTFGSQPTRASSACSYTASTAPSKTTPPFPNAPDHSEAEAKSGSSAYKTLSFSHRVQQIFVAEVLILDLADLFTRGDC